ncbi:hypothetical protein NODU109028_13910 [Nocardioides dubius]|uniref:MinD-like ATPase involved in chromosome partitioning or flagellar assembly n=1 Tax=Nocardioides dubius TaxID=317019 RepID=A0ABN1TLR7_9ACTN
MGPARGVLLLGNGAPWEAEALAALDGAAGLVVLKRCLDVADLLAAAATGQAQVAVLGAGVGLDQAGWQHLSGHGVAVVVVEGDQPGVAERWRHAGATVVSAGAAGLVAAVREASSTPGAPGAEVPSAANDAPRRSAGRGRLTVVWGPAGAPGRTTVALGLAAEAARRGADPLLLDLDPWGGTVAQHLGLVEEVSGLLACNRAGTALASRFVSHQRRAAGLRVITGLPRAERWGELRPGLVEELLGLGRLSGPVVVDTGFCLEEDPGAAYLGRPERNALTLDALGAADEVVAVGSCDPVGLGRLVRGLADLRERTAAPVRVVVNRMRRSLGWGEAEVATMLAGYLQPGSLHFLPEDRDACDRALVHGRTLVELGESPLSKAMARLADAVIGEQAPVVARRL